jgi:putative oxidoreductase
MTLPIPPAADRGVAHPLPTEGWAIPIRLIVGYGFMAHGWAKIVHGPQHFIDILHAIGIPAAPLMGWLTIVGELVCGAAVLAGAFIPLVSLPMIAILLVAIITVHLPNGFSSIKLQGFDAGGAHFGQPGYETDLLYLAGIVALVLGGPGPLSLDRWLRRRAANA